MPTITLILTTLLVTLTATLHIKGFKGKSLSPAGQRIRQFLPLSGKTSALLFIASTLAILACLILTMSDGPTPTQLLGLGTALLIQALARLSLYATTFEGGT